MSYPKDKQVTYCLVDEANMNLTIQTDSNSKCNSWFMIDWTGDLTTALQSQETLKLHLTRSDEKLKQMQVSVLENIFYRHGISHFWEFCECREIKSIMSFTMINGSNFVVFHLEFACWIIFFSLMSSTEVYAIY